MSKQFVAIISVICALTAVTILVYRFNYISTLVKKPAQTTALPTSDENTPHYDHVVAVNGKQIQVEIADTTEKMERGLSNRPSLPDNNGMYFVYPEPTKVTFWMPEMNFPIDMIFIKDNKVVYVEPNVPNPDKNKPLNQLPQYSPPMEVTAVLETPAGWGQKNGVVAGSEVESQGI
jgi:uncharacterized protein